MVFMAGVGLSAGSVHSNGLGRRTNADRRACRQPGTGGDICFLFGAYVLRMNRRCCSGAMMGARTCAPAMEII